MERRQSISITGIVLSSLLAVTCCIGPAVLLLTGASISFLGQLSFLEPFRPYFLSAGAVFLLIAFWTTFVKKKTCSCPADHRKVLIAQILTVGGLLLLIISVFFTQIVIFIVGG
jgi:mercuric ion transport protein